MKQLFKNRYRSETARLKGWDYGWNAAYFVTICTQNRKHYFGQIVNHEMVLSNIGVMAEKYWNEIPEHFPFVRLGSSIIMPNHVHGIITIEKTDTVATQNIASPHENHKNQGNKFEPQSQNLGSIIRGFKTGVKKYATINKIEFAWQPRYYDHIIRDDESFQRIEQYIINNPVNWKNDDYNDG